MKHTSYVYMLVASSLVSCGGRTDVIGPPTVCTLELRHAIVIDVRDSATNAAVGRGARIIARDGAYAFISERTSVSDGPCPLIGERAGSYTVTVDQQGYRPWSRSVTVTGDECHVQPVFVTARLQP